MPICTHAQTREIDSLKSLLSKSLQDTTRVNTLNLIARRLYNFNVVEMDSIAHESLRLAERIGFERGLAEAMLQIGRSYQARGRISEAINFVQQARTIFEERKDSLGLGASYHALGNIYLDQAKYEDALRYYITALRYREAKNDLSGIANTLNGIGILYKQQRKYDDALIYYRRSFALDSLHGLQSGMAKALNNIGLVYQDRKQYDTAAIYVQRSLEIEQRIGSKSGIAFSMNNLGVLYDLTKRSDSALILLQAAFDIKKTLDDKRSLLFTKNCISQALRNAGRVQESITMAHETFTEAQALSSLPHYKVAAENLAEGYKQIGDYRQALFYTELVANYRDTLFTLDRERDLTRMESAYKLEKQQTENDALRRSNTAQRWLLLAFGLAGLIATMFVVFLIRMNSEKKRTNERLQQQQTLLEHQAQEIELASTALQEAHERSEMLLRNMLPEPIADRLKAGETKIAERVENVCIMFADIVGFTDLASRLEPVVLVAVLDEIFTIFDSIAEQYGLEKIKTIGDAYMLVAGVPEPLAAPAEAIALAALAMQSEIVLKTDILRRMNIKLQVRVGIHAGEVVAGVIGTRKLVYDLWGDAVNIAHRMEAHGIAGQIQVSEAFVECFDTSIWERIDDERKRIFAYPRRATDYARASDIGSHTLLTSEFFTDTVTAFIFEERGFVEIKGKGSMKTYLLTARNAAQ